MFENYIEEQKKLEPILLEQYNKFPSLKLPNFNESGINFNESRVRINTSKWWREIKICANEMQYAYCFTNSYDRLIDMYRENLKSDTFNRASEILLFELPFWIGCLLGRLFSFREKLAQLIFYLNGRVLMIKKKKGEYKKYRARDISFYNVSNSIKDFARNNKLPNWLSSEDIGTLLNVLEEFESEEVKNLLYIRNAFIHNYPPAIDTTGTGLIITHGKWISENEFTVYFLEDKDYSYQQIEILFLKAWDRMREGTLSIAGLEYFK
ncbi:MAG: hypothetical protein KAW56_00960 [Candidatus Marinimicrobia bacterium]|nr:hypothetical protein [Candidatus Neomarinimicrobiota bacterium]